MLQSMLGALSADLAIDLGSASTRIFAVGRGLVVDVPTRVAILEERDGRRRLLAVGAEARQMEGRNPADVRVLQPVQEGAIVDFEVVEVMLRHLMLQVQGRRLWVGPRVAIAVPHALTDVERRAVRESAEASGAREVHLVEQPLAAAIGAGLPVDEACGQLVLDVGAGHTSVSVLSLGGIVFSRRLRVGGDHLDEALVNHLREHHGLLIPMAAAEEVRRAIGSVMPGGPNPTAWVRGRHLDSGYPRAMELDANEVRIALQEPVQQLAEAVLHTLERTPPDLAADVAETGVVLTGGVAVLSGLDRAISRMAGLPVIVAEEPQLAVVRGAAEWVGRAGTRKRAAG
jgi:rod shape-determining protein MreB